MSVKTANTPTKTKMTGGTPEVRSDKSCLATKPRISILGILAVLAGVLAVFVGVPAILVGVLGVLCIGMVYLLHEIEHPELG